jgi:hypothetical protein
MGAHKGRKWKDKPANIRYWAEDRRTENKRSRIRRCNGERYLRQWEQRHTPRKVGR